MKILFPKTYGLIHNSSQTRQKTSTKIKKKHMKFLQQKKNQAKLPGQIQTSWHNNVSIHNRWRNVLIKSLDYTTQKTEVNISTLLNKCLEVNFPRSTKYILTIDKQILTGFTKVLYCCKTPTRSLSLSVMSLFNLINMTNNKIIIIQDNVHIQQAILAWLNQE